jgi:uncharacterized OsmC-like protein
MLVGAVANCFILSFRAIARKAKLDWLSLECEVDGELDKIENFTQFTRFKVMSSIVRRRKSSSKKPRSTALSRTL